MSILQNSNAISAPAGGGDFYSYQIANSARFDGSASYLNKTWGSAPSSTTQVALSVWLKKTFTGDVNPVSIFTAVGNTGSFYFNNDDAIADNLAYYMGGGGVNGYTTNIRYRDPSAWFHFVAIINSAASNDYDRLKIYINGELIALNGGEWTQNAGYPNTTTPDAGKNGVANYIGRYGSASRYWSGYMADFIQIDGAAAISDFGETKNGVWIPKDPSGLTFGNNGFHLNFASSGDMGNDVSGNNNDWTANSIAASDQTGDSPTFNSDSNGGNFATMNPLSPTSNSAVYTEGNLKVSPGSSWSSTTYTKGTMAIPKDKKIYFEASDAGSNGGLFSVGVAIESGVPSGTNVGGTGSVTLYDESKYVNGSRTASWITSASAGNIVQVAVDGATGKVWLGINNTWGGSGNPSAGSNEAGTIANPNAEHLLPVIVQNASSNLVLNFGSDSSFAGAKTAQGNGADGEDFYYAPPTDFLSLCSKNLSTVDAIDPAQTDNYPQKLFSPILYTGNAGTNNITGLGFKPDWLLIKIRNTASNAVTVDSNRGTNKVLFPTNNDAEYTSANVTAFGTDGFSLDGTSNNLANFNGNNNTYVAWAWRANNGVTSSNSSGNITSVGQKDPSGCFSIVTYTGSGTKNQTVAHHLDQAPIATIFKRRNGSKSWMFAAGTTYMNDRYLNLNNHYQSEAGLYQGGRSYNNNAGSSLFTLEGATEQNGGSMTYVAYFFSNCEGYIKIAEYTGTGSSGDGGKFNYTGFRPAMVITKMLDGGAEWSVYDDKRDTGNVSEHLLQLDLSDAERTDLDEIDILSNGFKCRSNGGRTNQSSKNYVFLAFASNPFQFATAR